MAATTKSSSKKRPSFTAPTPPEKDEEVVKNSQDEVAENKTEEPIDTKPAKPTPPSKMITKEGPDKEASFDQVINEENPKQEEVEKEEEDDSEEEVEVVELEDDTEEKEVEETASEPASPVEDDDSEEKSGSFWKTFIIIILIILGLAGWLLFITTKYPDLLGGGVSLPGSEPTPTPTEAIAEPTPTPIDKSGVKIEVYNGVGISGAAGSTADTLEGMGYTIIDTGNADSSGYEVTEIEITPEFPDELMETFLADLESEFGVASISGELEEVLDSGANTQITLGADWFPEEE